jgi:hypothetical protein
MVNRSCVWLHCRKLSGCLMGGRRDGSTISNLLDRPRSGRDIEHHPARFCKAFGRHAVRALGNTGHIDYVGEPVGKVRQDID